LTAPRAREPRRASPDATPRSAVSAAASPSAATATAGQVPLIEASTAIDAWRAGDRAFAQAVCDWQATHGRHGLPWQRDADPYKVWLSEIMLQQTQVTTVLGYFDRFVQRFPTVRELALATLDEVLALWSGLGYYSRARNLHRCAQSVVSEHGGVFPHDSAVLATLPGIGRSTAAAIAAFCFGERVAILDGNVKRVLTRALGFDGDLASSSQERALWEIADSLLPQPDVPHGMRRYTQGLMDLGATVCTLRRPDCERCPLQSRCVAHARGQPQAYPVKTRKLKRGERRHALLWLQQGERVLLVQRPGNGVWAGLWSLPEFDTVLALQQATADWPGDQEVLDEFMHVLTHLDWHLAPVHHRLPVRLATARAEALAAAWPGARWVAAAELPDYGLPAPIRKLLASRGP